MYLYMYFSKINCFCYLINVAVCLLLVEAAVHLCLGACVSSLPCGCVAVSVVSSDTGNLVPHRLDPTP